MKSWFKKSFCALLAGLTLCVGLAMPASANIALAEWYGSDRSGVGFRGEASPVEIKNEVLTVTTSVPEEEYDPSKWGPFVTAEYTFFNPSDEVIDAELFFPFGERPDYQQDLPEDYSVMLGGEAVPVTLRHSFFPADRSFDLVQDITRLREERQENPVYSPVMMVTVCTFRVSDVDFEKNDPVAAFDMAPRSSEYLIYPDVAGGYWEMDNGMLRVSAWIYENGEEFSLYVFGEPPAVPEWTVYKDGQIEDGSEIRGSVELVKQRTIPYGELVESARDPESDISEIDWYNAVTDMLDWMHEKNDCVGIIGSQETSMTPLESLLMRWYQYELVLQPGEEAVNTVRAPIYPTINGEHSDLIYDYTYLLSPAKSWKSFGPLDIRINTSMYMLESSLEGWTHTDNGYTLSLDGLPDGELEFTLCDSEDPSYIPHDPYDSPMDPIDPEGEALFWAFLILLLLIPVLFVVLIVVLVRRHLRKKKNRQ